jgi:hypothetical protein
MNFANGDSYEGLWQDDLMHVQTRQHVHRSRILNSSLCPLPAGRAHSNCRRSQQLLLHLGVHPARRVTRIIHWRLGQCCRASCARCFNSEQSSGKRSGFGVLKLSNGDVYEGLWSNDERCGFGIMKYSSGEEYKGLWENGKFHGESSFTCSFQPSSLIPHHSYPCSALAPTSCCD